MRITGIRIAVETRHLLDYRLSVCNTITFSKDTFELISNYRVPRCLESVDIKELTEQM
jgi:hypothetical protein